MNLTGHLSRCGKVIILALVVPLNTSKERTRWTHWPNGWARLAGVVMVISSLNPTLRQRMEVNQKTKTDFQTH